MPKRNIEFFTGEYYHVFNRGVDKRIIFTNKDEMYFFFRRLVSLNNVDVSFLSSYLRNKKNKITAKKDEKLVEIIAYCLLPNHFHLILKQCREGGISKFMQRLGSSYVTFFNMKHDRSGALFQGRFKAKHIKGDYSLPVLSSYVNFNYKHHQINPKNNLVKSSIFEYLSSEMGDCICNQQEIENIINEVDGEYERFAKNASIQFANNKNIQLTDRDFVFTRAGFE